jgi:hypothetical protein
MQSQARGEERHQGLDEKWEAQNAWLLLDMQRQDVQVGEGVKEQPRNPTAAGLLSA